MKTFEDIKGRKWELSITVAAIKTVNSVLDIDISDLSEEGFIRAIADDPVKMVDMFWVLLKSQAENITWQQDGTDMVGVDEESFGEGFAGDTIDTAILAFTEELVDFFPKSKREVARKLFQKANSLVEKGYQKIEAEVDNLDEDLILKEAFEETVLPGKN